MQVLLSLPSFTADLRHVQGVLEGCGGGPLSSQGVYSALLECLAAKERWVPAGHACNCTYVPAPVAAACIACIACAAGHARIVQGLLG